MIRVALVEDDSDYRKELISYLKQYETESGEKINIVVFTDGDEIAEEYKADYDIILMDIEMKFMDGMTAAEKIRLVDSEVVIIFITNMPQFVMKGYTVDALDYVLKPITYFSFSQRIDRAIGRMKRRNEKYITITVKGGMQKINVSKIYYAEIQDHDLIFHTANGKVLTKGTMREVEEMLKEDNFFRCNKGYLINLEYVQSILNNDVVVGNDTLQVSRARKKTLLDALNDYMNEVGK
ncbi:LytR/AlgR family response regulator transcription factor [Konateibacter massiliensis]|uniref:LytR/AlgR family response regulator transcription factor n=1 Tax=Konateibacter massiliensis TaxID=2002841 RepID=UPI000C14B324|nr:LytTR family DNA-binding domain-containing protein [Konateibacter massiliensis]